MFLGRRCGETYDCYISGIHRICSSNNPKYTVNEYRRCSMIFPRKSTISAWLYQGNTTSGGTTSESQNSPDITTGPPDIVGAFPDVIVLTRYIINLVFSDIVLSTVAYKDLRSSPDIVHSPQIATRGTTNKNPIMELRLAMRTWQGSALPTL